MALSLIVQLAEQFRADLALQEATSSARLVEAYAAIFEKLRPQLLEAVAKAQADGATPKEAFRADRLQAVVAQFAGELKRVSGFAGDVLTARQRALVELAGGHCEKLTVAALSAPAGFSGPTWRHVPLQSLQNLVGVMGDGSPVHQILTEIAGEAAGKVRAAIITGLGAGQTPDEIVRGVRSEVGGSMARALTVVRTEDMRAYREAQRAAYKENADVVKGWRWWSSKSFDTCAACLTNHGREFPVGHPMDSHPNCRCIALPITKSWAELGHPELKDREQHIETGDEWLQRQKPDIQKRALGPSKFEAWQKGQIELQDLRGHRSNSIWGGMHVEVSLEQAKQAAIERRAIINLAKAPASRQSATPVNPSPTTGSAATAHIPPEVDAQISALQTTKHVEEWLQNQDFGIKSVDLSSSGGMHVSTAKELARTITELKRRFPKMQLDAIKMDANMDEGEFMQTFTDPTVRKERCENTLKFNPYWFGSQYNLDHVNGSIAFLQESDYWVSTNVRELTFHEAAHILTFSGVHPGKANAKDEKLKNLKFDCDISTYASENGAEGLSEAFAHFARHGTVSGINSLGERSIKQVIFDFTRVSLP